MDRAEIKETVIEIVADQMGKPKKEITEETKLADDLGADSLDAVEIVMELEDRLDLNIPDEKAEGIKTIEDIINVAMGLLELSG